MSAAIRWNIMREQMPQIVPTAGFSPSYCDYVAFTSDFDLSLLPESPECQVPLSPTAPLLSLEDGLFDSFGFLPLKSCDDIKTEPADEPLHTPLKKTLSSGFFPDMDSPKTETTKEEPLIPTTVPSSGIRIKEESADAEVPSDHQLLRSVLKDTSFQRKYNFRPFDLPYLDMAGNKQDMDDLEPVLNLAIQQIHKDVDNTCCTLGIARDPTHWTEEDVKAWVLWTARQFCLPLLNAESFAMDGAALSLLTEEDFLARAPQCGSSLHAHLEIWKAASGDPPIDLGSQWSPPVASSGSSSAGDYSEDDDEEMDIAPSTSIAQAGSPTEGSSCSSADQAGPSKRSSSAHIHLWQFLKELLSQPQQHGTCIRWLDRASGVFKIEDSVRVARLWGKRKNRPAMNYDKLSRSIRQYYKKGIMKKTERSQRLVYQFCHPYSL